MDVKFIENNSKYAWVYNEAVLFNKQNIDFLPFEGENFKHKHGNIFINFTPTEDIKVQVTLQKGKIKSQVDNIDGKILLLIDAFVKLNLANFNGDAEFIFTNQEKTAIIAVSLIDRPKEKRSKAKKIK